MAGTLEQGAAGGEVPGSACHIQTGAPAKPRVALFHGENKQRAELAKLVPQRYRLRPTLPDRGDVIEL